MAAARQAAMADVRFREHAGDVARLEGLWPPVRCMCDCHSRESMRNVRCPRLRVWSAAARSAAARSATCAARTRAACSSSAPVAGRPRRCTQALARPYALPPGFASGEPAGVSHAGPTCRLTGRSCSCHAAAHAGSSPTRREGSTPARSAGPCRLPPAVRTACRSARGR